MKIVRDVHLFSTKCRKLNGKLETKSRLKLKLELVNIFSVYNEIQIKPSIVHLEHDLYIL